MLTTCTKLPPVFKTFVLSSFDLSLKTGFSVSKKLLIKLIQNICLFLIPIITYAGLELRGHNENFIFLFLNQNICCGYSKEPSQ